MRVEYLKHKYNIESYHLNLSGFESSVVNILHAFVFLFAFQINPNSCLYTNIGIHESALG